jgi:glycosyltransferase involved in cell wall biosynthesis
MNISSNNRVLMLLENTNYPQDTRSCQEAAALVSAGYRMSIICPTARGQACRETLDGVRVYRFPAPRRAEGFLGYLWEYGYSMAAIFLISLRIFFGEGFDYIHGHNPPDTFVFIAAFYKLFGKRFVYDHRDLSPEMYRVRFPGSGNRFVHSALVLLEKLSCRLADHVVTANASHKKIEMERDHVPESSISIVRNGPDQDQFQPVENDLVRTPQTKTIIGYAGVTGFQDGVDYLLRAMQHLVYDLDRTDVVCVIVGSGAAIQYLKSLAQSLRLSNYVVFTGWLERPEMISHISVADICVAPEPSNFYNDRCTVIKILEYMALAKPIVAFDLPEHRFSAKEAAVFVKGNDEFAFARTIAELVDDPARRQAMGSFGRRRIETELAWQYSIPNLLAAYQTEQDKCQPVFANR